MENADSHAPPASTPAAVGAAGAALPIAPQPQSNPHQAVDGAAPAVVAAAAAEPSAAQPLLYAKEFYNTAVPIQQGPPPSEKQWKQARKQGPTAKLKEYHNNVKRYLINTLAKRSRRGGAQSLLDLACGRGGDIDKWIDAGIREVHGVDISANEIELARKRFEMKKKKAHRLDPEYTFRATDALGETRVDWGRQYDIATCMFAGHFFLQTEQMLDAFLGNVAAGLRDGGYYFGTIASGRAVLELLDRRAMYESPLLRVRQVWPGDYKSYGNFGSGYTFALGDTVTNVDIAAGEVVDDGAVEFLTFFGAYTQLAARHGLVPDPTFEWDPEIRSGSRRSVGGLDRRPASGKYAAFRMFRPQYDQTDPQNAELTKASLLYAAFVFVKQPVADSGRGRGGADADGSERAAKRQRDAEW